MPSASEILQAAKKAADAWRNTDTYHQAAQIIDMLVEELESDTLTQPNDFTPVRHGRWVKPVPGDGENYCSVCRAEQPWFYGYGYYNSNYCPSCGACMDVKEET